MVFFAHGTVVLAARLYGRSAERLLRHSARARMVRLMFGSETTSRVPEANWRRLFPEYALPPLRPLEPWFDKTWRVGEFVLGTDAVPLISLEQLCTKIGRSKLSNLPRRATSQQLQ